MINPFKNKKGLGRGLSALFGDIEKKAKDSQLEKNKIPIASIERNKYQPRVIFDEEKLGWCEKLGFKRYKIASLTIKEDNQLRIGVEHEKFLFNKTDLKRVDYNKIKNVFEILKSKQIPVISVGIMKAPVFLICLK